MPNPVDDGRVGAKRSPRRTRASEPPRGKRKVLMIAHAFPPTRGSGMGRSVDLTKYLSQFGWLPTVWTADDVGALPPDPAVYDEEPLESATRRRSAESGILAMRRSPRGFVNARAGEGLTAAASRLARPLDWRLEAECHCWNNSGQSMLEEHPHCSSAVAHRIDLLIKKLRSMRFELIYSTSSSSTNHLLALQLKRHTDLPWVADFRGLWTDESRYREPSPQRRAAYRQWEQEILEAADVVIAEPNGGSRFDGNGTEDLEVHTPLQLTRQLASVFDRLADRAAEAVETSVESLATCPP